MLMQIIVCCSIFAKKYIKEYEPMRRWDIRAVFYYEKIFLRSCCSDFVLCVYSM